MEYTYDIAIIGLGPAGIKAAKCALNNSLKVIAFEKEKEGGTCLNLGCIPTKAIMHSSELYKSILNSKKYGITTEKTDLDITKVFERKNSIIERFSSAVKKDLESRGAVIIQKEAVIKEEAEKCILTADNKIYHAKNIIMATGSAPFELKNLKFNHKNILSSDDILNLTKLPKNISIIGSGAIGTEWARIMSNFGVQVSVIEKADKLLPLSDIDISKRLMRMFKANNITFYTGVTAEKYKNNVLTLSDGKEIDTECVLVAAGRKRIYPKVEFNNSDNKLIINKDYTTSLKNVYAIGDIQTNKMLAHSANACAIKVIDNIVNNCVNTVNSEIIPTVIYGNPEIASFGINEQDLPTDYRKNKLYKIYNLPIAYLPKSWCDGDIEGFIKIITYEDKIIGAHIISKEASALITELLIAVKADMNVGALKDVIFAHPTYSEGLTEALENA